MSNFWANKIVPRQAPVAPPVSQPAGPWWQRTSQVQAPAPLVPQAPQPLPYGSGTPQSEEASMEELLGQQNYQTTKARSSLTEDKGLCPECSGPNYVGEAGKPNSMPHCYDCGYNPRFGMQTMSGISAGQNVPVKTARQQHGGTPDANFMKVIAHV